MNKQEFLEAIKGHKITARHHDPLNKTGLIFTGVPKSLHHIKPEKLFDMLLLYVEYKTYINTAMLKYWENELIKVCENFSHDRHLKVSKMIRFYENNPTFVFHYKG